MSDQINDCKTAELHLIGKIQPYGVLLAVDRASGIIFACSENTDGLLKQQAADIIGTHWSGLITPGQIPALSNPTDLAGATATQIIQTTLNGLPVLISSHVQGPAVIIELEPWLKEASRSHETRLGFLQGLSNCTTPELAADLLLEHVADITGFDRVMLYKFLPGWHGKVIAERLRPGINGFLGLHFPAGDIPENARHLYTVNMQRFVADVNEAGIPVLTTDKERVLDLTYAQLRAVHPVHLQYLQNIGACSSFSVSILVSGKLWGMVACHHTSPVQLGFKRRAQCEELARIVSLYMSGLVALEIEKRRADFRTVISEIRSDIRSELTAGEHISAAILAQASTLLQLFAVDGFWMKIEGKDFYHGLIPDGESLAVLQEWLFQRGSARIFHTDTIASALKSYPDLVKHASGLLFIPLNEYGFIVCLRSEQIENVQWAGRAGPGEQDTSVTALTPRTSFMAWTEQVHGHSVPWQDSEVEIAERLRNMLQDYLEKSELQQMALQDGLTGLANRARIEQELESAIAVSRASHSIIAVFMLDLDRFKHVNDKWGHAAGDELLIQVADRLKVLVRGRDVVARFGGDEFAIVLYHFTSISEVETVAARIVENIRKPFQLKEATVEIGVSIGIAFCPLHADTSKQLIKNADIALYNVKSQGRNNWQIYDPQMQSMIKQDN